MKQILLRQIGGPEQFEIASVEPGPLVPGHVRVRNRAIGVNFIDIYQRTGLYPASLPAVIGREGAGDVEAVASDVTSVQQGTRVAYLSSGGAYAETIDVPVEAIASLPDGIDYSIAAATFLKGLTVNMLVTYVFNLKPKDTALIYAATGGVGSLLCQWANHIDARVIAVVGNDGKVATARGFGASDVINRATTDDIAAAVREMTSGKGVNVVYDSIGAQTFMASLDCLAPLGMMVSYGNASGPAPKIAPLELTQRGSLTLARPSLYHFTNAYGVAAMAAPLFDLMKSGAVKPMPPAQYALADVAEAHTDLESGTTSGALVLIP